MTRMDSQVLFAPGCHSYAHTNRLCGYCNWLLGSTIVTSMLIQG
jgi:hypothetical protein